MIINLIGKGDKTLNNQARHTNTHTHTCSQRNIFTLKNTNMTWYDITVNNEIKGEAAVKHHVN